MDGPFAADLVGLRIGELPGFALALVGLLAIFAGWYRAARVFGGAVVALAGWTLLSWLLSVDLGLDRGSALGAVSPTAALGQLLIGAAIVLRSRPDQRRPAWLALFGGAIVVLGVSGIIVLLAQDPRLLGWGELTRMSPGAGAALVVFGVWALVDGWRRERGPSGLAPLAIGVTGTVLAVLVWQLLLLQRGAWIYQTATSTADTTAATIEDQLLVHALALRVMAEEWEEPERAPAEAWQTEAERTGGELPAFEGFVWVLPNGEVGWSYALGGADAARLEPVAVSVAAALEDRPDRLVEVRHGPEGTLLAVGMPMSAEDRSRGQMIGLLDGERLMTHLLAPEIRRDFAVTLLADGQVVSRYGWQEDVRHVQHAEKVLGTTWTVILWPNPAWLEGVRSGLPEVILVLGVVLALAVAIGTDLAGETRTRARQLSTAVQALRHSHEVLEQRVAERTEDLRRAVADLARSNEELEHFAGVASHDLKEPLNTVSLYLQMIRRRLDGRIDEESARWLDTSGASLRRMGQLVDDLLTYARVGNAAPKLEPVPLDEAIDHVLDSLQAAISEAGATVEREQGLPVVLAEPGLLSRVLQNLVANALKFRGEQPLRIEIGAEPTDGEVRVRVRDNGIGVEPEKAAKIFTMFDRGAAEGRVPGAGIGLATSQRIIERHGGRIGVEPAPGSGSIFWFTLRRAT